MNSSLRVECEKQNEYLVMVSGYCPHRGKEYTTISVMPRICGDLCNWLLNKKSGMKKFHSIKIGYFSVRLGVFLVFCSLLDQISMSWSKTDTTGQSIFFHYDA